MDNPVLSNLKMLKPENALSPLYRDKYPSLVDLIMELPLIVPLAERKTIDAIDDQWRKLPTAIALLPEDIYADMTPDVFWTKILKTNGEFFVDLAHFALSALSLPHSNAQCERIFSRVSKFYFSFVKPFANIIEDNNF